MRRTFGFEMNTSFVDIQLVTQTRKVNNGNPTALHDFAKLYADIDIREDKVVSNNPKSYWQRWNPRTPWTTNFTPEANKMFQYAGLDALLPIRIACGLAFTNAWPRLNLNLKEQLKKQPFFV